MHLTEAELVEHVEGALRAERAAHLASCQRCRRKADGLAAALDDARAVEALDPSPLFWEHFSARVRDAMDAPPESRLKALWGGFRWPGVALAGAMIVALLVIAGVWQRGVHAPVDPGMTAPNLAAELSIDPALEADPEWTFVATMADGIDWDAADAAGLGVRPGAAERAALQLSREEQTELARLLREELGNDSL
ncbi:MAG: hypothetical protein ACRD09_08065 [Vicinamibacterales bacterium]